MNQHRIKNIKCNLSNLIFKFLDMKLEGIEKRKSPYFETFFAIPCEEYGMLGSKKTGELYINSQLSKDLINFFGMELSNYLDVIEKYVEDRFNLRITHSYNIEI